MRYLSFALLMSLIVLAAACAPASTPVAPLPAPTLATTPAPVTTAAPATLTLWLPDWMVLEDQPGQEALQQVITTFEAEHGVQIVIIPRLPRGPNGLLDSLQKTKPVAPSLLPDIIALPFEDIPIAAENDLLQPLQNLLPDTLQADLYPFAQQVAMQQDVWMSIPFAADFEHLAFQPAALSDPPVNWDIILSSDARYAFPYGGSESVWTDALLIHYLSAVPEGTDPDRNSQALMRMLTFYEEAYRQGQIDPLGAQTASVRDTWDQALQGATPMAETSASLWLAQQDSATFLRFGPTPTYNSQGLYLMHGWAYAIITADETRQTLAAQLLQALLTPQELATWSQQAHVLPPHSSALARWPDHDFHRFVAEAMTQGFLMPDFAHDRDMARSIHQAVTAVLSGQMTAEGALNQAMSGW